MIKKENEVIFDFDKGNMENSIDVKLFYNGFNMMMCCSTMDFIKKMFEEQKDNINKQLENLSLIYFRISSSIKFLEENIEDMNKCLRKAKFDRVSFDCYNEYQTVAVNWLGLFEKLKISDLEKLSNAILDITEEKLEHLNNLHIILNKIKTAYSGEYLEEDEDITRYILNIHNKKLDLDFIENNIGVDIEKIDVVKELVDYLPYSPTEVSVEDMISKAVGLIVDFPMMILCFYLDIIDRYKNNLL